MSESEKTLEQENFENFQLALLEATLNASKDGILVVDHTTRKVRQINRNFLEIWRIPTELAESKDDNALIGYVLSLLKEPDQFLALVIELYSNPERKSFDLLNFKDGRTVERHSEPLIMKNQVLGRVWFFRDITERLNTEIQLLQTSRLASLGEMSGGIAHEINNPLTVILGRGAFLLSALTEKKNITQEKLCRDIQTIVDQSTRIEKIVKGLRSYARQSEGDPFVSVGVTEILNDTMSLCAEKFYHNGVKVDIIKPAEELQISCRASQIVQVLVNILNNAYDAIQEHDTDKKEISIKILHKDESVLIQISDTGPGVPANLKEKIMQPFFTTKPVGKGTGLGLSISYGIIEQHNGKLSLRQDLGPSVFEIKLPIANSLPKEAKAS